MKTPRGVPLFVSLLVSILLLCSAAASPVTAQYIYLDLNGDGLNTPADVLGGIPPVNVGVYLRTNMNRDGTPRTCSTGQPLSVGSFEFILHAVGGTLQFGALSGGLLSGAARDLSVSNSTDFYASRFDSSDVYSSPGTVLLGTIPILGIVGAPLLTFAASTTLSPRYQTSFGSQCAGAEGEHTMVLGRDWFDADGTFGTLTSNVSGTVFLDSNGTSGGNCALDPGEAGVQGWVVTMNPGGRQAMTTRNGSYHFQNVLPGPYTLTVAPPNKWGQTCPGGGGGQPVTVLLGQTHSGLNLGVRPSNRPPLLNPILDRVVVFGTVTNVPLSASDPDGTPVTFALLSGPGFATVQTTGPATGNLRLAPLSSDGGVHAVTVAASDGAYDSRRHARVRVLDATAVPVTGVSGKLDVSITPNPLNPAGTLHFRTFRRGFARVALYNVQGRLVRLLLDKPSMPAGIHEIPLDARDARGEPLASGVYLFRVDTVDGSRSERVTVVK